MEAEKTILVTSLGFSFGHDRAASALIETLEINGFKTRYLDIGASNDLFIKTYRELQNQIFRVVSSNPALAGIYTFLTRPGVSFRRNYGALGKFFARVACREFSCVLSQTDTEFDYIISTHGAASRLVSSYKPTIAYISDMYIHPADINRGIFKYAVVNGAVRKQLIDKGIDGKSIEVTGVAIRQHLIDTAEVSFEKRVKRLRNREERTILLAMGGAGGQIAEIDTAIKFFKELKKWEKLNLVLFIGNNTRAFGYFRDRYSDILDKYDGLVNLKIIYDSAKMGSFKKVDKIVPRVDIIVSKPDIWVYYGMLGIPIIALSPIGYQEVVNKRYGIETGFLVDFKESVLDIVFNTPNNDLLIDMSKNGFNPSGLRGVQNITNLVL